MDKKEFQKAFSVVRASDELRLEVLQTTQMKKRTGSLMRKVLIAAAIIALLATTALAAPTIINALKGGKAEFNSGNWYAPTGEPDEGPFDQYDLYLDIQVNKDAPKTLETYYMPDLGADFVLTDGYVFAHGLGQYDWVRETENGKEYIFFQQSAGSNFDPDEPVWSVNVPSKQAPNAELVELGGVTGYLAKETGPNRIHFFWSDGDYVFHIQIQADYSQEEIAQILQGVHAVEDIAPYIISD